MIKIGIIGTNKSVKQHIGQIKKIPEFNLIGIYNHDLRETNKSAREFNIKPFNSYDSFINSVDAIYVVSSKKTFYNDIVTALKNSKHIFIKSIKNYTKYEVENFIKLANEANVHIQVYNNERFSSTFISAKEYFNNPMYVETQYFINYEQSEIELPKVLDLIYTDLNLSASLIKSNPKKIEAASLSILNSSPDIINARISFDNGSIINLTAGRISNKNTHICKFFQRDAIIEIDFINSKTQVSKKCTKRILFEELELTNSNKIFEQLTNFHHSIEKNLQPIINIENELKILDIFEKILDKIKLTSNQI
ncbi:MAG: Gfo/Idh/MocA family oxidoreductase [Bacteroidales bacterium]|nr:Gfo/Idh/MocA family oxidoreductase [Bacteroidales bacterium]